jgi:hypothetical protein
MKVSRAIVCPDRRPGSEKAVLIGMRWEQNVQRNGRLNEDVTNGEPCGRADLSALPALSQAGGFDQVDAEAAALITVSARYWTSRATCLSDSRSLSARLPSRETRRNTLCPSPTPALAAAIQPPPRDVRDPITALVGHCRKRSGRLRWRTAKLPGMGSEEKSAPTRPFYQKYQKSSRQQPSGF